MKKYTQEEFDNLDIVNGVRQCPTGDYSNIKIFGKQCSFGEDCSFGRWCSFGKRCSFGEWCSFGKQCSFGEWCSICENELSGFKMRNISGLGDSNQTLYLWETVNGYYCQTDYFFGTESEFVEDVTLKYGGDHRYIKAVEFLKG